MKRALCTNRVPSTPGGGTVAFVNTSDVDFVKDVSSREEAGTPGIIQVRAQQLHARLGFWYSVFVLNPITFTIFACVFECGRRRWAAPLGGCADRAFVRGSRWRCGGWLA